MSQPWLVEAGRAWAGRRQVAQVELSADGGKSWDDVRLGEPVGRYAWRAWSYSWKTAPGRYTLCVRGTDDEGHTQPVDQVWSQGGVEKSVDAELVVDATGRGSQTPRWLEALGFGRPAESVVKVDVCYATRFFRRPPEGTHPWRVLFVVGESPESRRLGIVAPVEGGRWIALLVGLLGDHPPGDDEGWMAFARSASRRSRASCRGRDRSTTSLSERNA